MKLLQIMILMALLLPQAAMSASISVRVKRGNTEETQSVNVKQANPTILDVKQKLAEVLKVPVSKIALYYQGEVRSNRELLTGIAPDVISLLEAKVLD